jgi:hypothetical protein
MRSLSVLLIGAEYRAVKINAESKTNFRNIERWYLENHLFVLITDAVLVSIFHVIWLRAAISIYFS